MKFFTRVFMVFALCLSITACSDDDNENGNNGNEVNIVNPSNVFTNRMPKQVSDMRISQNAQGLITKIEATDAIVTFEYPNGSARTELSNQYVKMIIKGISEYNAETYTFDMEIGSNGFVKHCIETEEDGNKETWDFEYTAEGNLKRMKRSEGGMRLQL